MLLYPNGERTWFSLFSIPLDRLKWLHGALEPFYYIEDIFHWFLRLIVFANIMHKGEMKIAPLLILNEISIAEILSKDAYNRFFCLEYIYAQL